MNEMKFDELLLKIKLVLTPVFPYLFSFDTLI